MKIEYKSSKWTIVSRVALAMTVIFAGYALFEVVTSGLFPAKYILPGIIGFVIWSLLAAFLALRRFNKKGSRIAARIISVVMMIALAVASGAGLYVLKRGLSVLDGIAASNNAVTIRTDQSFNIFISGIDTYGEIANTSRSDVNILATVSPKTHKILLTTVPRDSYVAIPLGGQNQKDKLTHAGNYGPEASMGAVANLLNTKVDAYIRINFTSFIQSIDTLGGITIENPTTFVSYDNKTFTAGTLHLNGQDALSYSRERKGLSEGDVDRGKNQQRVIQGIVNKMTSIRSLDGFEAVLKLIGASIDTNMSQETIRSLINRQLDNPSSWITESYTLTGKGSTGTHTSFAMPNARLYMYILDESSVEAARTQIEQCLNS